MMSVNSIQITPQLYRTINLNPKLDNDICIKKNMFIYNLSNNTKIFTNSKY